MSTLMTPVAPSRPVAPYIGGKRNLARRLVSMIEAVPHEVYAEPFVGMGGVFLRRRSRPKGEVINDLAGDVANFFRVVQQHPAWLEELLAMQLMSRAEFDRLQAVDPRTLTDVQRAARFLYLQRCAFGGKVNGRNFAMDASRNRFDVYQLKPLLEQLHRRLARVTIENLDWSAFVARYDSPGTLLYLDPPYWACETDYGEGLFARADFARMAEQLARIRGRFILSLNDRPEVREIFAAFRIDQVATTYTIASAGSQNAGEVIISNL